MKLYDLLIFLHLKILTTKEFSNQNGEKYFYNFNFVNNFQSNKK